MLKECSITGKEIVRAFEVLRRSYFCNVIGLMS